MEFWNLLFFKEHLLNENVFPKYILIIGISILALIFVKGRAQGEPTSTLLVPSPSWAREKCQM
jgi:hypothetical protein